MIRAVLFDLGNVIIPVDFRRCHEALARVCAHPPEQVPRIVGRSGIARKYEQGEITTDEFISQTSSLLGLDVSPQEFWELWSLIFLPDTLLPESLLEGLRRAHRLLLLSNTNPIHFQMARERYPLLRQFHEFVLSYEVGKLKPEPEIYQEAIARAGCRPEECFFTDDLAANVEAARQQGMDAVQFVSYDQLQDDMRARGIPW